MMKHTLWRMLAVAAFLLLTFATRCRSDDRFQVFGGEPFNKEDYLWFCAVGQGVQHRDFLCGGTLISPRHVVTADHCLDEHPVKNLWVRVGYFCPRSDNCGRKFRTRNVIEIRRNPSLGDFAILVLSSKAPSKFVPAVPDVGSPPSFLSRVGKGGEMLMVGAGRDGRSGAVARRAVTLKIQLQHANHKKCGKAISDEMLRKELVSKSTICSISEEGKPCHGDSGSAIIVNDSSIGNVLVAVHSYGPRDCSSVDDKLFGHVAVNAVSDFVISVVCNGNLKDKKENWCPTTHEEVCDCPPQNVCNEETCTPFCGAMSCPPSSCPPQNVCSEETCAPCCSAMSSPPSATPNELVRATLRHDLTGHTRAVYSVAFDATSSRLASVGEDLLVNVWDPNMGGSPLKTFRLFGASSSNYLAFNPAGTILAVEDRADVALFDVTRTSTARTPYERLKAGDTEGVAWHPDGKLLASADCDDRSVKVWKVNKGNILHTFRGHRRCALSVSFDPQGRYLASSDIAGDIQLWDVSSLTHVRTIEGHTGRVPSVAFSPDGARLASGAWDDTVRIWRVSDGSVLGVGFIARDVNSVAWSSDGQFLVTGSDDGVVRVWDAANVAAGALLELTDNANLVWGVAWSLDGKWIASASVDSTVKIWEVSIHGRNDAPGGRK